MVEGVKSSPMGTGRGHGHGWRAALILSALAAQLSGVNTFVVVPSATGAAEAEAVAIATDTVPVAAAVGATAAASVTAISVRLTAKEAATAAAAAAAGAAEATQAAAQVAEPVAVAPPTQRAAATVAVGAASKEAAIATAAAPPPPPSPAATSAAAATPTATATAKIEVATKSTAAATSRVHYAASSDKKRLHAEKSSLGVADSGSRINLENGRGEVGDGRKTRRNGDEGSGGLGGGVRGWVDGENPVYIVQWTDFHPIEAHKGLLLQALGADDHCFDATAATAAAAAPAAAASSACELDPASDLSPPCVCANPKRGDGSSSSSSSRGRDRDVKNYDEGTRCHHRCRCCWELVERANLAMTGSFPSDFSLIRAVRQPLAAAAVAAGEIGLGETPGDNPGSVVEKSIDMGFREEFQQEFREELIDGFGEGTQHLTPVEMLEGLSREGVPTMGEEEAGCERGGGGSECGGGESEVLEGVGSETGSAGCRIWPCACAAGMIASVLDTLRTTTGVRRVSREEVCWLLLRVATWLRLLGLCFVALFSFFFWKKCEFSDFDPAKK